MNNTIANPTVQREVTSPAFWGSFLGILLGSILGGLSYLGLLGRKLPIQDTSSISEPRAIVVIFCCLLCVRYYASIIFLTYDDTTSPKFVQLEAGARRAIFFVQLLLIVGCSLNIALLPMFGGVAATGVIVLQATLTGEYWRRLGSILLSGDKDGRFNVVIAIGDFTIFVSAVFFFVWEIGWATYDATGAGMCMGAIIFIFIVEAASTYLQSIRSFISETVNALRTQRRE